MAYLNIIQPNCSQYMKNIFPQSTSYLHMKTVLKLLVNHTTLLKTFYKQQCTVGKMHENLLHSLPKNVELTEPK